MPPNKIQKKSKQADDFASVVRRLGCDDDKAAFEAKLGKIVKTKAKKNKAMRGR